MEMIDIRLQGPIIKAEANKKVTLKVKFDRPCWSCIHERRAKTGYYRLDDQQGNSEHVYAALVHEDTTHFIFSIGDPNEGEGEPDLAMTSDIGQLWCPVTISGEEPQPEPVVPANLLYKVGLISDEHFNVEDSKNSEYQSDLTNACQFFIKEGVNFVVNCGDICEYNYEDYEKFYEYYNAHAFAPTRGKLRLHSVMGNHDYLMIYHPFDSYDKEKYASREMVWQINVSPFHEPESDLHFFEYGAKWDAPKKTGKRTIKSKLNYWFEEKEDIFVCMSIDYGASSGTPWDDVSRGFNLLDYNNEYVKRITEYVSDTGYNREKEKNFDYQFYNPEVLCWLLDIIEANQGKRIFVPCHLFLPHKAGDSDGIYSHLRVWPYPTSDAIRKKFYSGSNSLCGLTFWFLNKINNKYHNVFFISGHSHRELNDRISICQNDYEIRKPSGNEVTPVVDNLESLTGTEYDYRLYSRKSDTLIGESGLWIGLPSLSKPVSIAGSTLYQASQGAIMEVYDNCIVLKGINFKSNASGKYVNEEVLVKTQG